MDKNLNQQHSRFVNTIILDLKYIEPKNMDAA
jgi:hypothetical protein